MGAVGWIIPKLGIIGGTSAAAAAGSVAGALVVAGWVGWKLHKIFKH